MAQPQKGLSTTHQRTRISREEIAKRTKISPIFLAAIEQEDFAKLPGGIFDRSYIRQYAEVAGLDAEEILAKYHEFVAERESRTEISKPEPRRRNSLRDLMAWVISA